MKLEWTRMESYHKPMAVFVYFHCIRTKCRPLQFTRNCFRESNQAFIIWQLGPRGFSTCLHIHQRNPHYIFRQRNGIKAMAPLPTRPTVGRGAIPLSNCIVGITWSKGISNFYMRLQEGGRVSHTNICNVRFHSWAIKSPTVGLYCSKASLVPHDSFR